MTATKTGAGDNPPGRNDGAWQSLPAMLLDIARRQPEAPMVRYWRGGGWQRLRWGEFAASVANVAAWLRQAGIGPGDRVLLVSDSRPEWNIADVALMAISAVTVPTYVTNTVADHAHIIADSGARAAIVGSPALAARLAEAAAGQLGLLLLLDEGAGPPGLPTHAWATALATPGDLPLLLAEVEQIPTGRLACLIYTSGTGGAPRGVMLPHRAVLANRAGIAGLLEKLGVAGLPYLSFLPLSHAYEHTVGGFLLPSCGMEIVYSRGADRLSAELAEVQPGLVTAVPRLFELLRARLLAQLEKETPFRRGLFEKALALGLRRMDGPPLGLWERVQDAVLDRLVRRKVRARFGGRLRALVSGGARLDPDLSGFFLALGLPLIQGYGQSEAGPVISVNLPWDNHRHTVGPPLEGVQAMLAADGELLVRGPLVMDGYWGNPEATDASLRPGPDGETWLHTGDVARMEQGRIIITDRKRDFIKTLGGDMVSPAKIEGLLMAEPEIAQAVVAGEGQAGIVALVVPAEGPAEEMQARAAAAIARVNAKLSGLERIRRWGPAPEPFSVENGLLTPTMKVKRRAVLERHAAEIGALYR